MSIVLNLKHQSLKRLVLGLTVSLLLIGVSGAANAATPRILLVGDSWAQGAWVARVFQTALINRGLGEFEEKGEVTALGGTTAAQWATRPFLQLITDELVANPEIDIVHLSIGGNDFLNAWPAPDLIALANQILGDTQTVVDHILSIRPEARIVHASYDYVPLGFNTEQSLLTTLLKNQAANTDGSFVLNNLGVLHHYLGYPGGFAAFSFPLPGGFPYYVPILGGNSAFSGYRPFFVDSIHPNDASYQILADHALDEFYEAWLRPLPAAPSMGMPVWLLYEATKAREPPP